jgi:hypothetical protein
MGLPFAHVSKKDELWRSSPCQFGDNPGQVSFAKHARPFQRLAWLQRFFSKIDLVIG